MKDTVLSSSMVWEGFDENFIGDCTSVMEEGEFYARYCVHTMDAEDGVVVVDTEFFYPEYPSQKTVVIVGEFGRKVQKEVVDKLIERGFNVVVPDYSGIWHNTETRFPDSLRYGYYREGGEHLTKVCPTAKETSYFLYARIIRRLVTFVQDKIADTDVALLGIKTGAEPALQVAGTDARIRGLALIGAAGYREYVHFPKYLSGRELKLDDDMMAWLTGVSGTAYAKHVKCPVMIAIGSNGTISDIDRISNFINVAEKAECRLTVSSGFRDNIGKEAFDTVLQWFDGVFFMSVPPLLPQIDVDVNSDGELYATVRTDGSLMISKASVFYAYNDNNHATRFWRCSDAEFAGDNEYLAKVAVREGDEVVFAYAEVEYVNGLVLDGAVSVIDLADIKVKRSRKRSNPIIYQYPDENSFTEISDDAVIMQDNLATGTLPNGLRGVYCSTGGMISYSLGDKADAEATRLLQIDTYSTEKNYVITVKLLRSDRNNDAEYTATRNVEVGDSFASLRFAPGEFKDDKFRPLTGWDGVKAIMICEKNVIVDKIMYV